MGGVTVARRVPGRAAALARGSRLHSALDRLVAALSLPLFHALRLSGRKLGLAVMYHAVGQPLGTDELVPAVHPDRFERQLGLMRRGFRIVPASQLASAAAERRRGQRLPLAITFDDDLPTHLENAVPILERAGLTAAFYLCGASLERPFAFWWERLQRAADAGIVDEELLGPLAVPAQMLLEHGLSP